MVLPSGHDLQLEAECRDVVAVFDVVHAKKRSPDSKYYRVPFKLKNFTTFISENLYMAFKNIFTSFHNFFLI